MLSLHIEPHTHLSEIIPADLTLGGLYIGSVICLLKIDLLTSNDIGAVLTCSGETFRQGEKSELMRRTIHSMGLHHKIVEASDVENYSLNRHFRDCTDFIKQHRMHGRNVLVHCHAGKSRSTSIVLAYLMEELGMSLESAYRLAKEKRPAVRPNPGFWRQLQQFQKTLGIETSVAKHCLAFEEGPTLQKRMSLQLRSQRSTEPSSLSQSLCFDRALMEQQASSQPLKDSTLQLNTPFRKDNRIKELPDNEVQDIKQKIRRFMQNRQSS